MFLNSISLADIFGYAGTVVGASLMLPQVYDSYKRKSMNDVSFFMLIMYFVNCILWATYGVLIWSLPVLAANIIAGIVGIILISMKIKYSPKKRELIIKKIKNKRK